MEYNHNVLRQEIIEFLKLLGNKENQLKYQNEVPSINVINELICEWFDDLYHPLQDSFLNSFSDVEKMQMKIFNDYFTDIKSQIRKDKDFENLLVMIDKDFWNGLVTKAKETLNYINH